MITSKLARDSICDAGPPPAPVSVSIVIPCYNEQDAVPQLAAGIRPVLDELERRHGSCELVLVDDGSRDGTGDALARALGTDPRVRLLRHGRNQGLGAALRTGFGAARGEIIVTTDADGTYDFVEIPALLERMGPEVDIVTASPYHPEGGVEGVPAYRLVLSRGASLIYRLLLDRRVYTYTSMFRAYRRGVLERVRFCSPGYLAMAEILAEALLAGSTVVEFPAVLRVRRYGQSKARVLRIVADHLRFQAGLVGRAAARRTGWLRRGGSK